MRIRKVTWFVLRACLRGWAPREHPGALMKAPSPPHVARLPLLDGGAKGAWSEVPPIEGPFHPEPGKVCPFESDRKPPSELASTQDHASRPPSSMPGREGGTPRSTPHGRCPPSPPPLRVRRPSRRANWRVPKTMLAAPPLDAGAKGARLEVAPIESRRRREGAPPPIFDLSYPAYYRRAPPSRCRGRGGTPGGTPHRKPPPRRRREGAPLRAPPPGPLRVRRQAAERTGEYLRSSYPAHGL